LSEIDGLVGVIFQHGQINPAFVFTGAIRKEAREYLARENGQPWSQQS
jgi:hypothetical protein